MTQVYSVEREFWEADMKLYVNIDQGCLPEKFMSHYRIKFLQGIYVNTGCFKIDATH